MAKGNNQRGNREEKKPKAKKATEATQGSSYKSQYGGKSAPKSSTPTPSGKR